MLNVFLQIIQVAIFASPPSMAAGKAVAVDSRMPIRVQYARTGRETAEQAEALGKQESDNGNPCVSRMTRELEKFAETKDMKDATTAVLKANDKGRGLKPTLVLYYMNESMEIRYELRTSAARDEMGFMSTEKAVYRKGIQISQKSGTWKERMDSGQCTVTEKTFAYLITELRDADRLEACKARKMELLDASKKVRNYIHNYMPVNWIDEARRALSQQRYDVTGVLREDASIYREGNDTFRECAKGLRLLEDEAAASVRVLNEVKATKLNVQDIPVTELEDLERRLGNSDTAR
jgi:hypothetical protein